LFGGAALALCGVAHRLASGVGLRTHDREGLDEISIDTGRSSVEVRELSLKECANATTDRLAPDNTVGALRFVKLRSAASLQAVRPSHGGMRGSGAANIHKPSLSVSTM
jgi:hypothetical protein